MKQDVTVEITNAREFDRVMGQYAELSSKDVAEAINHQTVNMGFKGMRATAKAVKGEIDAKLRQSKLIAYLLSSIVPSRNLENRRTHKGGVYYTRKEAKKFTTRLIRTRKRAVGFMRGFWSEWIDEAKERTRGIARKPNVKRFRGFSTYINPATPKYPRMDVVVSYDYRRRGTATAKRTEKILQWALRRAEHATMLDMRKYIERKLAKRAKQFSATGKGIGRAVAGAMK